MKLKVFAIKATGTYGGGMAVVAASEQGQAEAIASNIFDHVWNTRYHVPDSVEELPDVFADGLPRVLSHHELGE